MNNITGDTKLVVVKEWNTMYNLFEIGEIKTVSEFAQLLATRTYDFIENYNNGLLQKWFKIL